MKLFNYILADQMNMSHSNLYRKMKGLFGNAS